MMTLYKWGEINDRLKIETSDKVGPVLKFQDTVVKNIIVALQVMEPSVSQFIEFLLWGVLKSEFFGQN